MSRTTSAIANSQSPARLPTTTKRELLLHLKSYRICGKHKALSQSKFESPSFLGVRPEHKSVNISKMLKAQILTDGI
jgi:hypothetical protein